MATVPFLGGGLGDPARAQRRVGRQTADGVPFNTAASWVDFYTLGGTQQLTPNSIERAAITSSAELRAALLGKTVAALDYNMGDLDAGSRAQSMFFASAMKGYANPVTLVAGAYRHQLGNGITTNRQTNKLSVVHDDNDGMPWRVADVLPSGFVIDAKANANLGLRFPSVGAKYDYWGDATVTGTGVVRPIVRHTTNGLANGGANWDQSTGTAKPDLYIKIISDATSTVTFQTKLSSAGSYGASQTVTKGIWSYFNVAGVAYGTRGEGLQVYFPTGADGTYVDLDEWLILNRRAIWTPTHDTEVVVAEVQTRFYLDLNQDGAAEEFVVDGGCTITAKKETSETRQPVGGVQPAGTFEAGLLTVELAISRRRVDLDLQRALLTHDHTAVVMEALTDTPIGATAYNYGYTFVAPNCAPTGPGYSIGDGGKNRDESIVLLARVPTAAYTTPAIQGATVSVASAFEVILDTNAATIL